jgi:hypothetical protein
MQFYNLLKNKVRLQALAMLPHTEYNTRQNRL